MAHWPSRARQGAIGDVTILSLIGLNVGIKSTTGRHPGQARSLPGFSLCSSCCRGQPKGYRTVVRVGRVVSLDTVATETREACPGWRQRWSGLGYATARRISPTLPGEIVQALLY
jgi:hypothetical protein